MEPVYVVASARVPSQPALRDEDFFSLQLNGRNTPTPVAFSSVPPVVTDDEDDPNDDFSALRPARASSQVRSVREQAAHIAEREDWRLDTNAMLPLKQGDESLKQYNTFKTRQARCFWFCLVMVPLASFVASLMSRSKNKMQIKKFYKRQNQQIDDFVSADRMLRGERDAGEDADAAEVPLLFPPVLMRV